MSAEPIDAVYCWEPSPAVDSERLRYSLRSLDRKAPWIRKVHLVTSGDPPAWLRQSERLAVVRHEAIFRDRSLLPTSNPLAVEWHVHRIPGLSRRFLYLKDDCFLGRRVTLEDFVTAKAGYRVFVQKADIGKDDTAPAFTETLLNGRFGTQSSRKKTARMVRLLDRDFVEEVDRVWTKQVRQTAARRQPHAEDVCLATLYSYYLLECPQQKGVHEAVTVGTRRKDYVSAEVSSFGAALITLPGLIVTRPKFFHLNCPDKSNLARKCLGKLLSVYYPAKSSFELS